MGKREGRVKKCFNCGKEFICPYGIGIKVWQKRKYCSCECANPKTTVLRKKKCLTCGKAFGCPLGICISEWKKRKFCSQKCSRHRGMFEKGIIPWNKGKSFSKKIKTKMSIARLGKSSWNKGKKLPQFTGINSCHWKGGITPDSAKRLYTDEWIEIRDKTYKRDNWTCQTCGKKCHGDIQCHHIVPYRISQNNDMKNLTTLCKSCHVKIERSIKI